MILLPIGAGVICALGTLFLQLVQVEPAPLSGWPLMPLWLVVEGLAVVVVPADWRLVLFLQSAQVGAVPPWLCTATLPLVGAGWRCGCVPFSARCTPVGTGEDCASRAH